MGKIVEDSSLGQAPIASGAGRVVEDPSLGAAPLPTDAHAGMSHEPPTPMSDIGKRGFYGLADPVLEANKLAAELGLWMGHPQADQDLANAIELQNRYRAQYEAIKPQSGIDWAHAAGEMFSPVQFIPGPERIVAGVGTGANILRGALAGTKGGLFSPTQGEPTLGEKAKQVGAGAAGGAVLGGVIPEMGDEARLLTNEGVRLTPFMKAPMGGIARQAEEAGRSFPITGEAIRAAERTARDDFNRAVYNRALHPIGERWDPADPVGYNGVNRLRERIGDAYTRALQGTTFIANPPGQIPYGLTQNHLLELNRQLALLTPQRLTQFNNIVNQFYAQRVPANRVMDANTFKQVESELAYQARRFIRSEDPDQQNVGDALDEVVGLLRESHAAQNPQRAAQLQAANLAYHRYIVAEQAAARRTTSDGVFTPADMMGSLRSLDEGVRRNRFARGVLDMQDLARAGNVVMTPRLGTSGTVERGMLASLAALWGSGRLSVDDIIKIAIGGASASVPYWRFPAAWGVPTANIGTRVGQVVGPTIQAAAPAGGALTAQSLVGATNGMPPP